jgi:hypothetical protein
MRSVRGIIVYGTWVHGCLPDQLQFICIRELSTFFGNELYLRSSNVPSCLRRLVYAACSCQGNGLPKGLRRQDLEQRENFPFQHSITDTCIILTMLREKIASLVEGIYFGKLLKLLSFV